jgi:hypothetical protein
MLAVSIGNRHFFISTKIMRSRPWILIVTLSICFISLVTYYSWTIFKANEKIKNYLLSQLRPILGEQCDIAQLDMALGAVHLKGVNIVFKNKQYALWIEDLRIGYSLASLVKNRFRPQKSPQDIIFINPKLTIFSLPRSNSPATPMFPDSLKSSYWTKVQEFEFLKRITVSKGAIVYCDTLNNKIQLAGDIDGWISTRDIDQARLRLVGKLFQSNNYNLRLNGEIDIIHTNLTSLQINLVDFEWKERNPFFIPAYLKIEQGKVNGDVTITEKISSQGFDIVGKLLIRDGIFSFPNQKLSVTNINLDAQIYDWNFVITKSNLNFNGSLVTIEGKINNLLAPQFDLQIKSEKLDLANFQDSFVKLKNWNVIGQPQLSLSIQQSYNHPLLSGILECPLISINKIPFNSVKFNVNYQDSVLNLDITSIRHKTLNLFGKGKVAFKTSNPLLEFDLKTSGKIPEQMGSMNLKFLAGNNCQLAVIGHGNLDRLVGRTSIILKPNVNDSLTLKYNSDFIYENRILTLNAYCGNNRSKIKGSVFFDNSGYSAELNLFNFHETLYLFPQFSMWRKPLNFNDSQFQLLIKPKKFNLSGDYAWKNGKDKKPRHGKVKIELKNKGSKDFIDGDFEIEADNQIYNGYVNLIKDEKSLELKNFQITDIVSGNGKINLTENKIIEGQFLFSEAPVNYLYNLFTLNSTFFNRGELSGSVRISGTTSLPIIETELNIADTYIHDVGVYNGYLKSVFRDSVFQLQNFEIYKNNETIFSILGNYSMIMDQLNFNVLGKDIDLDNILTTLINKPNFMSGQADIQLQVHGALTQPNLQGKVTCGPGKIFKFSYDSTYFNFGSSTVEYADSGLYITGFKLVRNNEFEINGNGYIPWNPADSVNINIFGAGNILAILPETTPFFLSTRSTSIWHLNLTGQPSNIEIGSGNISIADGYLKLADVMPEIKDIAADISIEPDGFVRVKQLSGEIKQRLFNFLNYRIDEVCCKRHLEPFLVPYFGLELGIFSLETPRKGVPLHIPSLMAKGEYGFYEFVGRDSCEKFYISGPVRNPVIRGMINLRNDNIMFPFEVIPGVGDSSPIVKLLERIDWNVKAVPVKDVRYEKEIPSGIDNVYVNLIIDSGVGYLDFNNVIEDSTFTIDGTLESTEGNVDYLDFNFRIEKAGIEFDKGNLFPLAYGSAKTTVADSMGIPVNVYLTLTQNTNEDGSLNKNDNESITQSEDDRLQSAKVRWDNIRFQLSSDNPTIGYTESELLASLGYSTENLKARATDLIGISTDNLLFRPLLRPFERQLEHAFNLDMVRVSSRFTRNLIEMNFGNENYMQPYSKLYLLRSTKLTVGKYLADRLFLMYTGQLESGMNYRFHNEGLGLKHTLGLEYRINPSLQLEMEYNYNSFLLQREDKRIFLRHSFPLNKN